MNLENLSFWHKFGLFDIIILLSVFLIIILCYNFIRTRILSPLSRRLNEILIVFGRPLTITEPLLTMFKKDYTRFLITLTFLFLSGIYAYSQECVLTLDSCRAMALRTNKTLAIANEAIIGAGYERKAAKAAYLPGIDFTATYLYNQRKINLLADDAKLPTMSFNAGTGKFEWNILTDPQGNPILNPDGGGYIPTEVAVIPKDALSFDTHNVFAGAVTLTQPIYMGGTIKALNDIAKYAESAAVASRNALQEEVTYIVDEAYWLVVSLNAKQRLAQSFVELVDNLKENVQALLDEGMATRSDLLSVDVKLNEARIMLTKVENGLSLARMNLNQLCGRSIDLPLRLADEDFHDIPETAPAYTFNMTDVYSHRQDLEALRQGVNLLKGREKLVLGAMLPKIGLIGSYEFSTPNLNNGFSKKVGGGFTVGAALTIPVWHWGGNYHQYKAAQSSTRAQQLLLNDMEEKIQLQVSQAKFKFIEAFKTYDMTKANMRSAEENLENARTAFTEGVMTTSDVILAQTGWLQANSEKIDAAIGVRLCEVYLAKVLGTLSK